MRTLGFGLALLYCWCAMVMFGGLIAETILIYPNALHDAPASLRRATDFLRETNPGDFFPPLGASALVLGIAALVVNWRAKIARYCFALGAVVIAIGDFLVSVLFMWGRNQIMFEEGTAKHSAAYLRQVASEFEALHLLRIGAAGIAAIIVFFGVLHIYRQRVGYRNSTRTSTAAATATSNPSIPNAGA